MASINVHHHQHQRFVPGLQGLRGLAVIYTTLCHIDGVLSASREVFSAQGVTIFYVLSGYLVSRLLFEFQNARSKVDLVHFYTDRAVRLFPELLVMILLTGIAASYLDDTDKASPSLLQNGGVALLFLSDFESLWSKSSRNIWINTWSVSLEAQFYIYWSLMAPTIFSLKSSRHTLMALLLMSIPSVWVKWHVLEHGFTSPTSVFGYCAPFSHIWKMMLGASLNMQGINFTPRLSKWSTTIGIAILLATLSTGTLMSLQIRQYLYYFEVLAAFASASIIYGCIQGSNLIFANRLLCYLGRISYPLYLYQDPLIQIAQQIAPHPLASVAATLIALLAATLSSSYIGEPIRTANKERRKYHQQDIHLEA